MPGLLRGHCAEFERLLALGRAVGGGIGLYPSAALAFRFQRSRRLISNRRSAFALFSAVRLGSRSLASPDLIAASSFALRSEPVEVRGDDGFEFFVPPCILPVGIGQFLVAVEVRQVVGRRKRVALHFVAGHPQRKGLALRVGDEGADAFRLALSVDALARCAQFVLEAIALDLSRNLIRIWVEKSKAGTLDASHSPFVSGKT